MGTRRRGVRKADDAVPDGKELIDLTVDEVSLVGKPAIKRKFSVTKQDGETEQKPKRQSKKKEGETPPITISKEVAKAVAPLMTQLAEERLELMVDVLKGIGESLSAGTLTSDTAYKQFSIIYSMLWKAESEVTALADALSLPKMEVVEKREDSLNKAALKNLMKSLTQEEDGDMGTPKASTEVKKEDDSGSQSGSQPGGQEQIVKAVTDAVGPAVSAALAPLETRIAKLEQAAAPATPAAVEKSEKPTDAEAIAKIVTESVSKALQPVTKSIEDLGKRLDVVEGTSGVSEGNTPEPKTKSDDDLWGGVI